MFASQCTDRRPAVVDGQVVWLPTLAGLLRGEKATMPSLERTDLWSTLAAAVVAQATFDEIGFTPQPVLDLRA
ncbi:MAG: hypothetical protein HKN24_02650 [Acidimicrobiales bacterium]|nr:hypothetical protein [Acidimicrobiales bacterium]